MVGVYEGTMLRPLHLSSFLYDLFLKLKVTIFASYIENNAMYVTGNGIDDVTQPSEKDSLKLIKWVLNN